MRVVIFAVVGTVALAACGAPRSDRSVEQAFAPCAVCHTAAPPDTPAGKMRLVGPPLWGVYGRAAASVEGFAYSKAMREAGLTWDDATLDRYLADPQAALPRTMMSYAGEPDAAKRAAIIEYLKTLR